MLARFQPVTIEIEIGITLLVLAVLAVVYFGVRSDIVANRAIQAGDSLAFDKRVRSLMRDHNYSEEKATAAVQRVKDSSKRHGSTIVKIDAFLLRVLGLVVLGLVVWVFLPAKTKYALEYETDSSNVIVEAKPHNCDWETAPLGAKNCHYEKNVIISKDATGKNNVYVTWDNLKD
jgi:hypothetical protein